MAVAHRKGGGSNQHGVELKHFLPAVPPLLPSHGLRKKSLRSLALRRPSASSSRRAPAPPPPPALLLSSRARGRPSSSSLSSALRQWTPSAPPPCAATPDPPPLLRLRRRRPTPRAVLCRLARAAAPDPIHQRLRPSHSCQAVGIHRKDGRGNNTEASIAASTRPQGLGQVDLSTVKIQVRVSHGSQILTSHHQASHGTIRSSPPPLLPHAPTYGMTASAQGWSPRARRGWRTCGES